MNSKIIELKNKKLEELIRKTFNKPSEPLTMDDVIAIKPIAKLYMRSYQLPSEHLTPNVYMLQDEIKALVLRDEENILSKLYLSLEKKERKYMKLFGLCIFLGVSNIYDIGCGFDFQAGYLAQYKDISYTGIDNSDIRNIRTIYTYTQDGKKIEEHVSEKIDFEFYNNLFKTHGIDVNFVKAQYPYRIQAKDNNIAIMVGTPIINVIETFQTLAKDFERVIVQVNVSDLDYAYNVFKDFAILRIDEFSCNNYFTGIKQTEWVCLFVTKHIEEKEFLETSGYNYYDERFFVDVVDATRYIENLKKRESISKK